MKMLLTLSLVFSFGLFADGHDEETPNYETNQAAYSVNVFHAGTDMDDLMNWSAARDECAHDRQPSAGFKHY